MEIKEKPRINIRREGGEGKKTKQSNKLNAFSLLFFEQKAIREYYIILKY
jgi:hypothetical protein